METTLMVYLKIYNNKYILNKYIRKNGSDLVDSFDFS